MKRGKREKEKREKLKISIFEKLKTANVSNLSSITDKQFPLTDQLFQG